MNNFKSKVNATRKQIAIIEAEKVAKEIQQYGGIDIYKMLKAGQLYAIVIDGIVVGGAANKEDAAAAVEFLTHFTEGKPLNRASLEIAAMNSMEAMNEAQALIEAEEDGIGITQAFAIDGVNYIIDDTNELYTTSGKHICNVADIVEAKQRGALSDGLYNEIIKSRIAAAKTATKKIK